MSQEAGTGSPPQEARDSRSEAMLGGLGWEEVVSWWREAREAGVESPLRPTIVLGRRVQVERAR